MHVASLYASAIASGALKDVGLTIVSSLIALLLGIAGALARLYGGSVIGGLVYWYVELIRGLPAILQLFIIFFGLTQFGIDLSPVAASVLWLVAYGTGYAVEIFRAGIMEVPTGQREAADALGLSSLKILQKIIVPQAWVGMLPNLTSFLVLQLKNTTLLYLVGYADIMYQARLGADATEQPGILYLMAALAYLVIALVIAVAGLRMERRAALYR
ncbi:MAG: amino acid ABC transporter permease [Thermaerobacter sp.]|nr:amino acid ABC transporter permease [Thermaerobacter sp.]